MVTALQLVKKPICWAGELGLNKTAAQLRSLQTVVRERTNFWGEFKPLTSGGVGTVREYILSVRNVLTEEEGLLVDLKPSEKMKTPLVHLKETGSRATFWTPILELEITDSNRILAVLRRAFDTHTYSLESFKREVRYIACEIRDKLEELEGILNQIRPPLQSG